ncbi:LAO/AO transport system kinase [Arenibacter nanhaiticus]|uniref:LAO/AO transport system kinase n=1 Tax=Arenibacter nanhaiticus TaxID=558155 RepID=A0A1M6BCL5_9FLAO|nr:methylmalonyl Co-A mutase-associated GTPase MeaB [Arenibacter nanhaiticus]SHI46427.1 LAO/AO transport system kinase [Arenibacter nanhaiticus]
MPTAAELIQGILTGDRSSLARAITMVESTNTKHLSISNEIIEACLPHSGKSIRLGITGVPGVGKSTFIEALGTRLTSLGKKVAVLAVDPSSTLSKGSILGDKTRMPELVKNNNAFIRPSPSSSSLGGVARKTRESIILCEAAGYDTILIETVGVGQSETAVHSMVDFFLLLKITGAGDELQGIKRGIVEMADAIVINKADGQNIKQVDLAKLVFTKALHLYPPKENNWVPPVLSCSSLTHQGIAEIWEMIQNYITSNQKSGYFYTHRKSQNKYWLLQTIEEHLQRQFYQNSNVKNTLDKMIQEVIDGKISPFSAAEKLIRLSKER